MLARLAFVALLAAPSVSFAQGTARVRVDDEALDRALAVELELRGYSVTDGEADGTVWTDTTPDARRWGHAQRTGSAGARVELTEGEDPRVTAVVLAALFDEQMQLPVRVPPPPPVEPFPWALMFYGGVELGPHLLLGEPWEAGGMARAAVGLQWRDGPRIGVVGMVALHWAQSPLSGTYTVTQGGAGIELGARTLDPLFAVHYGLEAILSTGRELPLDRHSAFAGVLATYLGLGLWPSRHLELGLRIHLELWLDEQAEPRPHATLAFRVEWR